MWHGLFKKVSPTVVDEPPLPMRIGQRFERSTTITDVSARGDILATGIFQPLQKAVFDVAVIDTGSPGRARDSAAAALAEKEQRKRSESEERVATNGQTFMPLVSSVYGTLAPAARKTRGIVCASVSTRRMQRSVAPHTLLSASCCRLLC